MIYKPYMNINTLTINNVFIYIYLPIYIYIIYSYKNVEIVYRNYY